MLLRRSFSTVKQRIQSDLLQALRSKDAARSTILKQLQSELVNFEKSTANSNQSLSDVEYFNVLRGCAKKWEKAIFEYKSMVGSNPTRVEDINRAIDKEVAELDLINSYLPSPFSDSELLSIVSETTRKLEIPLPNPKKMGQVMKAVLEAVDQTRINRSDLASLINKHLS